MANEITDPSLLRQAKAYAKQQYEKQMVRGSQAPVGLEAIGAPTWSRDAWEAFRATYGRYPSMSEGDLPNMRGAPDWAYELMGKRRPLGDVQTGSGSVEGGVLYPEDIDKLTIWDVK